MHKTIKSLFAAMLACTLLLSFPVLAEEQVPEETPQKEVLLIRSTEDFLEFAENCIRDIYSRDLTVSLEADLNFAGRDFKAVPSFSGTFLGNHHTIKGIRLQTEGSQQGLFRYLTQEAQVRDLTVMGQILPGGSKNAAGGIAGSNSGTIRGCRFQGTAAGNESVGGIAGINEITGIVEDCSTTGTIQGAHFAGGIAGTNLGVIRKCRNMAKINVKESDNKIDSISFDKEFFTGKEAVETATDLGGIAGTSSGVIRSSVNSGDVGYPRMGYNIGGICGSQKGFISDCKNQAVIQGRKEIGGIAGQLEPVVEINFQKDTIQILRGQLNATSALANRAASHVQSNSKDLQGDISSLHQHAETAADAIGAMLPHDGNMPDHDTVIAAQNTLSSSLSAMRGSVSSINSSAQAVVGTAATDIRAINNSISEIAHTLDTAGEHLGGRIIDISDEDTEDNLTGKIRNCRNTGPVSGDLNIGGIAGAAAWENDRDPEDDMTLSGDKSLNFDSKLRAVILNCSNTAPVEVSKRNAGGIVGSLNLGLLKNCLNTGFVTGEQGDYLGGIAGTSLGFIRNASAKCRITGHSFLGGIAGSASIVSDCRSTSTVVGSGEKLGSLLGIAEEDRTESEHPIHLNYYLPLSDRLGAIDGIDRYLQADSLEKEDFLRLPDLPSAFYNATMTFRYPGGSTKNVVVPLGHVVPEEKIPVPPVKPGQISSWDGLEELDLDHMYFDVSLDVRYDPTTRVLQSDALRWDGKPVMLAEGEFGKRKTMHLEAAAELPLSQEVKEAWMLPDLGTDGKTVIHLTVPEHMDPEKARVLIRSRDGEWTQRDALQDGTYLIFSVDSRDQAAAVYESNQRTLMLLTVSILAGLLILILLVAALHLKKKKKLQKRTK